MKRLDLELLFMALLLIGIVVAGGKVMYDLQQVQPIIKQVVKDLVSR